MPEVWLSSCRTVTARPSLPFPRTTPGSHSAPARTPSYRLHKPTRQAVVTLNGRDLYLGVYGSPESRAEYGRLIAEWLSNGRRLPAGLSKSAPDLTVNELARDYLRWAEGYYRKGGVATSEVGNIKSAFRPLRQLYGHTQAREFGPLALKAVRQKMVEADVSRTVVNDRCRRIRFVFKWAAEEELIPVLVYQALACVAGLQRGRTIARETAPVQPVEDAVVDATLPFLNRHVRGLVEFQRLTGCRPGEAMGCLSLGTARHEGESRSTPSADTRWRDRGRGVSRPGGRGDGRRHAHRAVS